MDAAARRSCCATPKLRAPTQLVAGARYIRRKRAIEGEFVFAA
jgi:hypothetical protein